MTTFDANKFFEEDTTTPNTTSTINMATDGLPLEVLNYVDNYNQQKETEANYVAGYGLGFTSEIGTGLGLSYALNSSGRATNAARNAKYLYQTARGIQATNLATSYKSFTPWGAAAQVAGFVGAEATIWATSNYFGQSIRKAYGVQDKIYAGELISTAVFGSFAQPIEKGMEAFKIGDRLIKSTKWKISDGLVDLGAWKAREVVIKGVPKMVSGATLGLAESALRQELAIQVFEDQESRNAWDYLISTGAGAGINSLFGIFSKTGAWGRTQATTLSQRAVDRMGEAIELINADIAAHIAKGKGGNPRAYGAKLRKLKDKLREHQDARDILDDNLNQFKQADEINTKVETEKPTTKPVDIDEKPPKPLGDETPEVKPTDEPEVKTVKETTDAPTTPKDTPVPKDKLDQEIENWDKDWKNAVNNDVGSTVVENIIIRANKLFDNAIFNENIFLRKFTQGKLTKENLIGYRDTIITQIKLLDSVFAQINSLSGRAIRANRADIENVANRSVDSQNTAQLKLALNNLKTRLDEMIGDDVDDFVPTVNKLLDEEDVVAPGKGEGIDSDAPTATTSKVQDALEKRIAKLQKELDELVKGKEKATGEGKPKTSRTEDARIVALKRSIKNVKKYKAEAKKVTDLESEVATLAKIAERNDIDEMRGAIKGSPKKPKEELNKRIAQLKKQQQAAKKLFRERVRKVLAEEQKALRNQESLKLYKAIRDYTESEIAQNASNTTSKVLRGARLMRKMALVNSLTSVQAGVATGVIEMFKLLPRTLATRLLTKGKAGDKFAMHELEGASYAWSYLFNKEKRGQVWKHMTRAFNEGEDPMFDKSSRFNDDTPLDQQILPSGTRKVIQKATRDAEDEAMGVEGLNKFLKENLSIGGFLKLLSFGGRGILAIDSGFKKILFEQKVLVEMRQQGTLKFPNDPVKAKEYSDKLFKNAFEDSDGLLILGKLEEMEYDFMKITENLMMASRTNNIEDVADNMIRKTFIDPIAKIVNDDSHMRNSITAALLETVFFTFYKTAVYTVAKSAILANPLRVLGLKMNPYKDLINDLNRNIAKERIAYKQFREQLKDSKDDATKERLKKELQQSNQRVKEFETRIDRAEKRKFKYNQEVLTDVIMQIGVGGMAFGAGYAGYATGSNAFLTEAQKKRNPNMKPFQFMGTDYKAAAPVVFLVSFMADLGRYTKELGNVDKNGKPKNLSKETTPFNMFLKSIASAAQEMPTSQASRDVRNLFDEDKLFTVVSKWVASYIPNPQQVKKITRQVINGEDVPDLRGASFGERLVYSAFGFGNKKIKRNMMGEPEISSYTAFHTVNRYAGSRNRPYEPWEEIVATDKEAVIPLEPSPKLEGLNMREFVDEEGTDLYYHFLKRIQEYGLQDIMNDFVESNQFQADFEELQIENNEAKNLGLESFKTELRYHYNIIKEDLLADESFLQSFIGEDERTILEHLDNTDEFITIDKAEPMELKTFSDILPKF
jgi:hypothetical protein